MRNFIIILLFFLSFQLFAYDSLRARVFRSRIILNNSAEKIYGYLYRVTDSAIIVSNISGIDNLHYETPVLKRYPFQQVKKVYLRRKGIVAFGALGGVLLGVCTAAGMAYSEGDDPPGIISFTAQEKALMVAFPGAMVGAAFGLTVSSFFWTYEISGNRKQFNLHKKRMRRRAMYNE